jgi:hypothetical protein
VTEDDSNQDAAPREGKTSSLPGRGEGGGTSREDRIHFRALPPPLQGPITENPAPVPKAILPEASNATDRKRGGKRLKPVKVVTVSKADEPVPSPEKEEGTAPVERNNLPREQGASALTLRENERVLIAAGLISHQKVARLGGGGDVVFRCPVCSAQNQAEIANCGGEIACSDCGAVLLLPEMDSTERIRVVSLPKQKADDAESKTLELPDERSSEGRSGEARFQAIEELLPEGDEGILAWGLEKSEMAPDKQRRSAAWLWFGVPLFLIAAAILVRQIFLTYGRAEGEVKTPGEFELVAPSGEVQWDALPAARKFLLVDQCLRAYLDAPDLAAKAALSRGGAAMEARMAAFYQREGGYEPETRQHGEVRHILLQREKSIGGKLFQFVNVRFAESSQGVFALERTPHGYLVDWDYAEGYGEMTLPEMIANPPEKPVLLRVHLSETLYFADGFDQAGYRAFTMTDRFREKSVQVFAPRKSKVEDALARAWNDALLDTIGDPNAAGSGELDFVLRVRHENAPPRMGFVIDEVLMRGWIVPEEPK